jgi:hypothetical protein
MRRSVLDKNATTRKVIDIGCSNSIVPVTAQVIRPQGIDDDQQKIRPRGTLSENSDPNEGSDKTRSKNKQDGKSSCTLLFQSFSTKKSDLCTGSFAVADSTPLLPNLLYPTLCQIDPNYHFSHRIFFTAGVNFDLIFESAFGKTRQQSHVQSILFSRFDGFEGALDELATVLDVEDLERLFLVVLDDNVVTKFALELGVDTRED